MQSTTPKIFINLILTLVFVQGFSQNLKVAQHSLNPIGSQKVNWHKPLEFYRQGKNYHALSFDYVAYFSEKNYLPYLYITSPCSEGSKLHPIIQVIQTETLSPAEEICVDKKDLTENFSVEDLTVKIAEKKPHMFAKLVPVRINKNTSKIEKLISYNIQWQSTGEAAITSQRNNSSLHTNSYAPSSVLASGKWYKIGTTANGIYKIDKALMNKLGIDIGSGGIDPRNIQIYGNGGEILSEDNADFHYDDLIENAVYSQGETDGIFDDNDYILFYGQAPGKWKYNGGKTATMRYVYNKHYYADTTFYFLTIGTSQGKRIQTSAPVTGTNYTVTSFDDFQLHEVDGANLVKSGRELFGENFETTGSYNFNFNFPGLVNKDTVWVKTNVLGRRVDLTGSIDTCYYDVYFPGSSYKVKTPTTCPAYDCDVGREMVNDGTHHFIDSAGSSNIGITVSKSFPDEAGWLNYIWVVARRALTMAGNQMTFRDYRSIGPSNISQYNLQSNNPNLKIWNVSDMFNITEMQTTYASGTYGFSLATDSLKQFVAFNNTGFLIPSYSGEVANQNLHAIPTKDYIIVTHPMFKSQAQRLADLHAEKEKYTYAIVTPEEIYNEFSSGLQDITAIRQFVRMQYKNATTTTPKYLLIFGDASYIQKDMNTGSNTNFVPVFETQSSASFISSKCSDDFYGFLDDNEGVISWGGRPGTGDAIDIGIGRLPVHSSAEADAVTNKIISYYARKVPSTSCCDGVSANAEDWRNWVCLIADDANPGSGWERTFIQQSDNFAAAIGNNKRYNVDKIYLDAYQVVSVPGGRRYPDVVTAIDNRIARGALIMGYSGHGGELGLAHEEVITVNQIQNWTNINNMPLFFTATCEFSRFDDPARTSAGEYIIINGNGGGIGLFTTTRLAYATDGPTLGNNFYPTAVNPLSNGNYPAMGDIIRKTKFLAPDFLHFALLGDPATKLSYPKENTTTTQINSHITVTGVYDTLKALGKYTVTGFISDTVGNKVSSFNGTMYPTVFDKSVKLTTLDNGQNGFTDTFRLQKNAIYRGKTSIKNGDFSFSFIVPKDIFYNNGIGKISYFAQGDTIDAAGYYSNVIVGGTSDNPISDNQGPGVKLFMNTNQFVSGGITNDNPYIYAEITDSSGINTTGNGLGHDIVATLDANTSHAYVLNDYYQADLNKYQSGKVKYQITNLSEGHHSLNLKVWDILNNSSLSSTDFVVAKSAEVALEHVLNYPNPFTTSTKFFVEHNQACDNLTIEIQIFTITGHAVKTIQQTVLNEGFRIEGISWDGRDDYGDKLARGVYIYKITVKNDQGSKASKMEKLVILN
ncbi:MAG: type IX secretion system sortase PorU [Bacteroidia bacterium]